ncbi:MAG: hypothetical protein LBE34_15075 [Flavobacteriaceae bacterium]|jgi:hypothetical protein|nr:hypothetical protein [Flavobacteriaceae bacterium]
MRKYFTLGLVFTLIMGACNKKDQTQEIHVDEQCVIDIPSTLVKTTELHPEAVVQFKDANQELYVIVIKEPINEVNQFFEENQNSLGDQFTKDFKGYADLTYLALLQKAKVDTPILLEAKNINGANAYVVNFDASVSGLDVFYNFAAIKGKTDYYQILVWTLNTKKEKHKVEMDKIINSFRMLE